MCLGQCNPGHMYRLGDKWLEVQTCREKSGCFVVVVVDDGKFNRSQQSVLAATRASRILECIKCNLAKQLKE